MTIHPSNLASFKVWIFPSLVSLVALLIWNDVQEIKTDVKVLMAQSYIDKTRIDNLERVVYEKHKETTSADVPPIKTPPASQRYLAILPDTRLLKKKI